MSETSAETSAATPSAPPDELHAAMAEQVAQQPLSIRALLEAGVHFGHQTGRWNPRMKPYIFGERDGIHILNLDATLPRFQAAVEFLRETVAAGGKVLFVGTKRQAQGPIEMEARRCGQFYVNNRWLGGMLTNFRTVKKSIERYKEMRAILDDEEKVTDLSKKERARVNREVNKYARSLEGIKEMTRLPDALLVIDIAREHIAVTEARRLGIPIVAVVDTNCDPEGIDYVIPGNDDAMRAIFLYCARAADACAEGQALHEARVQSQATADPGKVEAGAPTTGRVVVEIKQPPRRGRGAEGAGGRGSGRRSGRAVSAGGNTGGGEESPPAASESPAPTAGAEQKPE